MVNSLEHNALTDYDILYQPRHLTFLLAEGVIILVFTYAVISVTKALLKYHSSHVASRSNPLKATKSASSCPFTAALSQSDITSTGPIHLKPEYRLPALKSSTSARMTMGLRRLDRDNWLTINSQYAPEHSARTSLLKTAGEDVLTCLPGSEASCHEVLSRVSNFLVARYPGIYSFTGNGNSRVISNSLTGEAFYLGEMNKNPLETAARLAMEDFNVLVRGEDGEYRLAASATLFPAGWKLQERIGGTMAVLHTPVPQWKQNVGCSVNRYFDHLSPTTSMERHPFFIQTSSNLFQDTPLPSSSLSPSSVYLRRERQTFIALEPNSPAAFTTLSPSHHNGSSSGPSSTPRDGASAGKTVLFTVHTFLQPLTSLDTTELRALVDIASTWTPDMRAYKGSADWLPVMKSYLTDRESGRAEKIAVEAESLAMMSGAN